MDDDSVRTAVLSHIDLILIGCCLTVVPIYSKVLFFIIYYFLVLANIAFLPRDAVSVRPSLVPTHHHQHHSDSSAENFGL